MNHSSWWDGLIAYFLSRRFGFDGYCMMEEKQLRRLRPFTWIGAFSVVRENPRQSAASIRYAIELLRGETGRALWIFPQGEILPNDHRPITFFGGLESIARKTNPCVIVPIALRYEFLDNYKPSVFVSVGGEVPVEGSASSQRLTGDLETSVTRLLDDIAAAITERHTEKFLDILQSNSLPLFRKSH